MKTTEIGIIFILGSLTLLAFVFFIVLIIIDYRKKQVRHITEKLQLKHNFENEVLQTKLEVQEQSFKYLSEEIHDNIAQALSLVKIRLYQSAQKATDETLKKGIEHTNELLGSAINDLRNLSHVLNGGFVSELSLPESIEKELNYIREANNIKTELSVVGNPFQLDAEKKLLIFRIIQEAVNNAIKHGKANEIGITLSYMDGIYAVKIVDNGIGFNVEKTGTKKGLGLHNIYSRAKLLGDIEISSVINQGTTIKLNIKTNE